MTSYSGSTTRQACCRLRSAYGRLPLTSARPPDAAKGVTSLDANNIFILRYMDYSIILPMASLTYIWTMIIAYRLLGESITKRKIFGVIAIIVGAVLLAHG